MGFSRGRVFSLACDTGVRRPELPVGVVDVSRSATCDNRLNIIAAPTDTPLIHRYPAESSVSVHP